MSSHAGKFLFLAAVVAAVLFSRAAYPALTGGAATSTPNGSGAASQVPLFVLPPVAVNADGAAPGAASASATASNVPPGATPPPALHNAASLVMDMQNGAIVESKNPDRRWPTASLAKLMSATIVLDKIATSTAITITNNMFAADPDERHLVVGGRYTVEDLLHLMLMPSSNVAAQANADFYGLSGFLSEMNARAAAWGMANTHFDDPSGISAGDESTAMDLAKLAEKIYADYPRILALTDTLSYDITNLNTGAQLSIRSINQFAGESDFIGGKTGNTDQADENLLSIFRYNGRPVLVIVLGTNHWFGDTVQLFDWFKSNFK